jgi:hypothetical protein
MGITDATREGDAESNAMVERDEDFNTRYAGYKGSLLAWERTKLIPRSPAAIDLTSMIAKAGADTVDEVVDHFLRRFLSVTVTENERARLTEFLRGKLGTSAIRPGEKLEESLRELLAVVWGMSSYQAG